MLRETEFIASSLLKLALIAAWVSVAMPSVAATSRTGHSHHGMTGQASYYSHGQRTASGERFNPAGFTAAHRTLPFGTRVVVTNLRTNKHVVVRINDRGPFVRGRIIDLMPAAARALGMAGLAHITLERIK